jgi:hypothetical protein
MTTSQVTPIILGERRVGGDLHLHRHGVERALTGQDDLIMRRQPRKADQDRFQLRRKNVDAADDQHVVVAPSDAHDAHMGAAADAGRVVEPRDVPGPVADHRQRFLGQRGDHQFAACADR